MIQQKHQLRALRAIHDILVVARNRANKAGDKALFNLLDAAEILPKYLAEPQDRTGEFRQAIEDLVMLCPETTYVLANYDANSLDSW